MLFSSYTFLLQFLPATALAFAAARRHSPRAGILVLLGASLFFYGAWQPIYLALLLVSIAFNFWFGLLMEDAARRRAVGILGITLNLAALGYFKYTNFILDALGALSGIPLPVSGGLASSPAAERAPIRPLPRKPRGAAARRGSTPTAGFPGRRFLPRGGRGS